MMFREPIGTMTRNGSWVHPTDHVDLVDEVRLAGMEWLVHGRACTRLE